jgi:GTP-binding protein EngB required for normal cell division
MSVEASPHESAAAVSSAHLEPVEALGRIAAISGELGAAGIAIEANELAERVSQGRFYVACVGQFKRGKSTLLNALVGEPMLPTGITPVTAVPTVIRFGDRHGARVRSTNGDWKWISVTDLEQYVSEEHNPENAKGIEGVEVFVPSPLLATGMCLVDTPGLGSVFSGNTATTQAFIPHIDAAVVVIGADPPISGEELALVEAVAHHVHDIHIVLNKSDRVTDAERRAAGNFARKMLVSRLQRPVDAIYEVSALEQLVRRGPERDWGKFIAALEDLVEQSGRGLIRSAAERGVRRLGEQLLAIINEERDALRRPLRILSAALPPCTSPSPNLNAPCTILVTCSPPNNIGCPTCSCSVVRNSSSLRCQPLGSIWRMHWELLAGATDHLSVATSCSKPRKLLGKM